ncbi:MAG: orotidine 5'-phosphate decarboxylase / HUMPS family protein [Candidatus Bathyarchaeia archaeon]
MSGVPRGYPPLREISEVSELEMANLPLRRISFPQIQVALDMDSDIKTIVDVAVKAFKGGARIIEAGTPAIKRHGADTLIPALRNSLDKLRDEGFKNDYVIVADMKVMDVGDLEARIAYRAGADIVCVLGIGSINKIKEALSEAIRKDKAIIIDLIQCDNPLAKIDEIREEIGEFEDWFSFCIHRGISEQKKGRGIHEDKTLIEEVKKKVGASPLFVAGGIKEGVIKDVVAYGGDVCVIGGAIYTSVNPEESVKRMLEEARKYYHQNLISKGSDKTPHSVAPFKV